MKKTDFFNATEQAVADKLLAQIATANKVTLGTVDCHRLAAAYENLTRAASVRHNTINQYPHLQEQAEL